MKTGRRENGKTGKLTILCRGPAVSVKQIK